MKRGGISLGKIIRFLKARSTRIIRKSVDTSFQWERNYYERIIRDDKERYFIESYIELNPLMWEIESDGQYFRKMSIAEFRQHLRRGYGLRGVFLERLVAKEIALRKAGTSP